LERKILNLNTAFFERKDRELLIGAAPSTNFMPSFHLCSHTDFHCIFALRAWRKKDKSTGYIATQQIAPARHASSDSTIRQEKNGKTYILQVLYLPVS